MSVKGFKLSDGTVVKYDYSSLDNIITDSTLSVDGVAADAGAVGDELSVLKTKSFDLDELDRLKLTGLDGSNIEVEQLLSDFNRYEGIFTANVDESIENWLDEHPEATTTVQDGSLGHVKLTEDAINFLKQTAKVIFMPVPYYESTDAAGECTVFVTNVQKKVIMIDAGATRSYSLIKSELQNNNITHIDVFILTHYHGDHYGNINNLISDGYIDSSTISYLPRSTSVSHETAGWGDETGVRNSLAITTVRTPDSNTPLLIDGMKFNFFNCDASDVAYYDSQQNPDCNDYSVCCYVTFGNTKILMTGDIQPTAEQYLFNKGDIRKCDILKIPHHASYDGSGFDFYLMANPTYAVASVNSWSDQTSITLSSYRLAYLQALGTDSYILGGGAIYVGINDDIYTLFPNEVKALYARQNDLTVSLYVNNSYAGETSNGTSTYPFKTLQAAISKAQQLKSLRQINIVIVGTYEDLTSTIYCTSIPNNIAIIGERSNNSNLVTLYAMRVKNSAVDLTNINIIGAINTALEYHLSKGTLTNVVINGDVSGASSVDQGRGFSANNSEVLLTGCTISNKRIAIMCTAQSSCTCQSLSGSNNEYLVSGFGGNSVIITSGFIGYTNLKYFDSANRKVNFVKYSDKESYSNMMDIAGESTCPWSSINSKLTIDSSASFYIAVDRIRYVYIQAKANDAIAAWETLLSSISDKYKPFQTNGAYTINIADVPYGLNFNNAGLVNTPRAITANQNVRISILYLAATAQ